MKTPLCYRANRPFSENKIHPILIYLKRDDANDSQIFFSYIKISYSILFSYFCPTLFFLHNVRWKFLIRTDMNIQQIIKQHHLELLFQQGSFGIEKESQRVRADGSIVTSLHPKAFGNRCFHPYITN